MTFQQLQLRKSLTNKRIQLQEQNLKPFWPGEILKCVEAGALRTYTAVQVSAPAPCIPNAYPHHPNCSVRGPANPATDPTAALAAASAAARAALAPMPRTATSRIPNGPLPDPLDQKLGIAASSSYAQDSDPDPEARSLLSSHDGVPATAACCCYCCCCPQPCHNCSTYHCSMLRRPRCIPVYTPSTHPI